jgi:hypothetical protein
MIIKILNRQNVKHKLSCEHKQKNTKILHSYSLSLRNLLLSSLDNTSYSTVLIRYLDLQSYTILL